MGHGTRWESKCGIWLRIQHSLGEMERGIYGNVMGYYTQSQILADADIQVISEEEDLMALLSNSEKELVTSITKSHDTEKRKVFEETYSKWEKTWYEPQCMMSSNPGDYAKSPEFRDVVALGQDIVPLLMEKLTDPHQFFALQAVAQVAHPELIVTVDLSNRAAVLGGEQERAAETVRRWLAFAA